MGWNEWMLGQIDFPLDLSAVTTDAENFYLNLGVLSGMDEALATDQYVNILISESTAPFNDNTSNNGADVFTTDMEVYKYQIRPVDWIGWRYVAIPYSDFEVKSQGGDNVRTPADISAIGSQCQSCPSANANCPENADVDVRTDIDFVMFTENARCWINDALVCCPSVVDADGLLWPSARRGIVRCRAARGGRVGGL